MLKMGHEIGTFLLINLTGKKVTFSPTDKLYSVGAQQLCAETERMKMELK